MDIQMDIQSQGLPVEPPGLGDALNADAIKTQMVSPEELNAWRRGFTPQAELWNGRLAMLGLSVGLGVVVLARLVYC